MMKQRPLDLSGLALAYRLRQLPRDVLHPEYSKPEYGGAGIVYLSSEEGVLLKTYFANGQLLDTLFASCGILLSPQLNYHASGTAHQIVTLQGASSREFLEILSSEIPVYVKLGIFEVVEKVESLGYVYDLL